MVFLAAGTLIVHLNTSVSSDHSFCSLIPIFICSTHPLVFLSCFTPPNYSFFMHSFFISSIHPFIHSSISPPISSSLYYSSLYSSILIYVHTYVSTYICKKAPYPHTHSYMHTYILDSSLVCLHRIPLAWNLRRGSRARRRGHSIRSICNQRFTCQGCQGV